MTPVAGAERLTAEERREQILRAALTVFAQDGYSAASTEEIARRAGISQPYLFRLFRTKRELVLAAIQRCFDATSAVFEAAARDRSGPQDVLETIGMAYQAEILSDPVSLRAQLQAYAACDDPEIRALVAGNYGRLVDQVQRLSGADWGSINGFFAQGMLLNVLAMLGQLANPEPWAAALIEGCTAFWAGRHLAGGTTA
ncbi:MAG: helix-turn-helix domain-containing protein [Candidatus Dormibacteria bacterium]|jgi:AcrR family transcriptional regulator